MPEFLKKTSTANILIIVAIVGAVIYFAMKKKTTAVGGTQTEPAETEKAAE